MYIYGRIAEVIVLKCNNSRFKL